MKEIQFEAAVVRATELALWTFENSGYTPRELGREISTTLKGELLPKLNFCASERLKEAIESLSVIRTVSAAPHHNDALSAIRIIADREIKKVNKSQP